MNEADTKTNELISVLIPAYNAGNLLDRCLESVIGQTYKNLDILIVVQPSSDNTVEHVYQWQKRDERIRVIYQEKPDVSLARNNLIRHISGKYACFVDDDDFINKNHIKIWYRIIKNYDADIVQGKSLPFKNASKIQIKDFDEFPIDNLEVLSGRDYTKKILNYEFGSDGNVLYTKLFKPSLYHNISFPEESISDDIDTTYRVAWRAKKVVYFGEPTYYYQAERSGSITHDMAFRSSMLQHAIAPYIRQVNFFKEKDGEIYGIALYSLCNSFSRFKEANIIPDDDWAKREFYEYKQYLHKGLKSSLSIFKKIILLIGYYLPEVAKWLREIRWKYRYKKQWKDKG